MYYLCNIRTRQLIIILFDTTIYVMLSYKIEKLLLVTSLLNIIHFYRMSQNVFLKNDQWYNKAKIHSSNYEKRILELFNNY